MTTFPDNSQQARLAAIYEVSARLTETLDLEKLLNAVMDATIELTNAERGFIMLTVEETGDLGVVAARNFDKQTIMSRSAEISTSVVERAVARGDAVLTSNAQEDNRFANYQSVIGYQLRSIMCTPLRARGQIIGVAYVDNRFMSSVFSQEDLALLATFANQAAMAIDNARLFTQTDQALRRRVEELSVFQQIDRQLNRSLDLRHVLGLALDWAVHLTHAHSGALGLIHTNEQQEDVLRLLVQTGVHSDVVHNINTNHPVLTQVLEMGEPASSRHESANGSPITQLVVPIKKEGNVIGLILLDSPLAFAFPTEDIAFVERLADRAAVAIENARLYEAISDAKQKQNDFVAVVTHELRAPMTSIMGYTDLVLTGAAGILNAQQRELLDIVANNATRMKLLVNDLADINRIEMGKLKLEFAHFDIESVVDDVIKGLSDTIRAKKQRLSKQVSPNLPLAFADRARVVQILTNLVNNAHKYTLEGGRIGVRVRCIDNQLVIDVIDNGIGISAADQKQLFTQFFRAEGGEVRKQKGWGLGLSIVKMLIEEQNGEISCRSECDKGSIFTFTLPIDQSALPLTSISSSSSSISSSQASQ